VLSLLAAFCFSAQALAQPSGKTAVIGYLAPVVAQPGPNARLEGFRSRCDSASIEHARRAKKT